MSRSVCQHDPLKPKTSLRVETHPFAGIRVHCEVCDGSASVGKKSGKIRLLDLPVLPSAVSP